MKTGGLWVKLCENSCFVGLTTGTTRQSCASVAYPYRHLIDNTSIIYFIPQKFSSEQNLT